MECMPMVVVDGGACNVNTSAAAALLMMMKTRHHSVQSPLKMKTGTAHVELINKLCDQSVYR